MLLQQHADRRNGAQVAHDVNRVKQVRRLGSACKGCIAKRLAYIHHRRTNAPDLLIFQSVMEPFCARLRAILPAEADQATANQFPHRKDRRTSLAPSHVDECQGWGIRQKVVEK